MVKGRVGDEIDGVRRALGSSELDRIAPHCTLVAPVNVAERDVGTASELLASAAAKSGPLAVILGPPATFFPPNPVCYLKVSGDLPGISSLRQDLGTAPLVHADIRDRREFIPHVTIGQKIPPDRIAPALETLSHFELPYCFESVTLIEFDQEERRWVVIADARLGPPRIAGRGGLELELAVSSRLDPATKCWAERVWSQYSTESYGGDVREYDGFAVAGRLRGEVAGGIAGIAEGEMRGPVCRLSRLIVAPEWRSHGVGSQLLREVIRLAAENQCTRVRVETLAGGRAEGFYRERGFAVVAGLPRWREERDFVMMERSLGEHD